MFRKMIGWTDAPHRKPPPFSLGQRDACIQALTTPPYIDGWSKVEKAMRLASAFLTRSTSFTTVSIASSQLISFHIGSAPRFLSGFVLLRGLRILPGE